MSVFWHLAIQSINQRKAAKEATTKAQVLNTPTLKALVLLFISILSLKSSMTVSLVAGIGTTSCSSPSCIMRSRYTREPSSELAILKRRLRAVRSMNRKSFCSFQFLRPLIGSSFSPLRIITSKVAIGQQKLMKTGSLVRPSTFCSSTASVRSSYSFSPITSQAVVDLKRCLFFLGIHPMFRTNFLSIRFLGAAILSLCTTKGAKTMYPYSSPRLLFTRNLPSFKVPSMVTRLPSQSSTLVWSNSWWKLLPLYYCETLSMRLFCLEFSTEFTTLWKQQFTPQAIPASKKAGIDRDRDKPFLKVSASLGSSLFLGINLYTAFISCDYDIEQMLLGIFEYFSVKSIRCNSELSGWRTASKSNRQIRYDQSWAPSLPFGNDVVAGSLAVSLRGKVVLELRQFPHSLLVGDEVGVILQNQGLQQVEDLEELSEGEVEPHQAVACDEFVLAQDSVELFDIGLHGLNESPVGLECLLEAPLPVGSVDIPDVVGVHVLENSQSCIEGDLLVGIPAQQVEPVCSVAEIHANGITFGDDLIPVQQIGESDCGIFLGQLGLDLLEPLLPRLPLTEVLDLLVADPCVLAEVSDPFGEASDRPISQSDFAFHVRIC